VKHDFNSLVRSRPFFLSNNKIILGILIPITVLKTLEFHQATLMTAENDKDLGQTNHGVGSPSGENEGRADTEKQDNDDDPKRNARTETGYAWKCSKKRLRDSPKVVYTLVLNLKNGHYKFCTIFRGKVYILRQVKWLKT